MSFDQLVEKYNVLCQQMWHDRTKPDGKITNYHMSEIKKTLRHGENIIYAKHLHLNSGCSTVIIISSYGSIYLVDRLINVGHTLLSLNDSVWIDKVMSIRNTFPQNYGYNFDGSQTRENIQNFIELIGSITSNDLSVFSDTKISSKNWLDTLITMNTKFEKTISELKGNFLELKQQEKTNEEKLALVKKNLELIDKEYDDFLVETKNDNKIIDVICDENAQMMEENKKLRLKRDETKINNNNLISSILSMKETNKILERIIEHDKKNINRLKNEKNEEMTILSKHVLNDENEINKLKSELKMIMDLIGEKDRLIDDLDRKIIECRKRRIDHENNRIIVQAYIDEVEKAINSDNDAEGTEKNTENSDTVGGTNKQ
jgi:hypothetical protein